jgi:Condensation domain
MSQAVTRTEEEVRSYAIAKRAPGDPCPLSFSQQRLWFLDQLSPADPTYNIPYAMTIRGPLDVPALQKSLDALVGRHEILRTTFDNVDGTPVPVVAQQWRVELKQFDLRRLKPEERQPKGRLLLKKESVRGFNLARDLMLRGVLLHVNDDEWIFMHVSHHVAWEFRSTALMYGEVAELYAHFAAGKNPELPELPIQFADFALWQRQFLQGEMLERLGAFWKEQLRDAPTDLGLPVDFPRPSLPARGGKRYPMVLSGELLDAARAVSLQSGVTPFMSLFGAFNVFLSCCTGAGDVCVGSPIARRRRAEIEPMIGFFVNTLVLRSDLSGNPSFRQLLGRISRVVLGAIAHADLPFDKLVEIVRPPRTAGRMPLFQVNFRVVKETVPVLPLCGLEVSPPQWIDNGTSKFDLSLELVATGGAAGFFEYSTDLFKEETIAQMAEDYERVLRGLIEHPDVPLSDLEVVNEVRSRMLHKPEAR